MLVMCLFGPLSQWDVRHGDSAGPKHLHRFGSSSPARKFFDFCCFLFIVPSRNVGFGGVLDTFGDDVCNIRHPRIM